MRVSIIISVLIWVVGFVGCVPERAPSRKVSPGVTYRETVSPSEKVSMTLEHDIKAAQLRANEQSKPMIVFCTLPGCQISKRMLEDIQNDEEVCRLSNRFICVTLDASQEKEFCQKYAVLGFPSVLILSSHGIEMKNLAGKQTPDELAMQMHVTIQSLACSGSVRK